MDSMAKENYRNLGFMIPTEVAGTSGTINSTLGGNVSEINVVFDSQHGNETLVMPVHPREKAQLMSAVYSPMGEGNYD